MATAFGRLRQTQSDRRHYRTQWHPVLFVSIFAILGELEHWGYPFEFVVVSNCDTDLTPEILEHGFRHWISIDRMNELHSSTFTSRSSGR